MKTTKPDEFTKAGDLAQRVAFAAYDKRVEVLETELRDALAMLHGKPLTPEQVKRCERMLDVLNAGK